MQRSYSAIDLRGYPSALYEAVCQVIPLQEYPRTRRGITGVEVDAPFQLKKVPKADLIFARGGTVQKNRTFLNARVNVLSHPYPFDSVQARLAAEHKVALELCFREVLKTSHYTRVRVLDHLQKVVNLSRKYHAPLIITSGASSLKEVLSPRQLVAFGVILGLDYGEAKASIYKIPKKVLEGVS